MTIRILPAIGDQDAARAVSSLLNQLPDADPAPAVADSAALLDALAGAAAQGPARLPEAPRQRPVRPPSRRSPRSCSSMSASVRHRRWS